MPTARQVNLNGSSALAISGVTPPHGGSWKVTIRHRERGWLNARGRWQEDACAIDATVRQRGTDVLLTLPMDASRRLTPGLRATVEVSEIGVSQEISFQDVGRLPREHVTPEPAGNATSTTADKPAEGGSIPGAAASGSQPDGERGQRRGDAGKTSTDPGPDADPRGGGGGTPAVGRRRSVLGRIAAMLALLCFGAAAVTAATKPEMVRTAFERVVASVLGRPVAPPDPPPMLKACDDVVALDTLNATSPQNADANAENAFKSGAEAYMKFIQPPAAERNRAMLQKAMDGFTEAVCWSRGAQAKRVVAFFTTGEGQGDRHAPHFADWFRKSR